MTSSPPPQPLSLPPPSPPQPLPNHQHSHSDRVEITIFIKNLPKSMGRRDIFSLFNHIGRVTNVFIPRLISEVVVELAVLNVDGLKLKDKFLHVKRAVFRRKLRGSRDPAWFSRWRQIAIIQGYPAGGEKDPEGVERVGYSVPPLIVIDGESHGVKRLRLRCVIEWEVGSCTGIQDSHPVADLGIWVSMVKIGRYKCLLVFDSREGVREGLGFDGSWWVNSGSFDDTMDRGSRDSRPRARRGSCASGCHSMLAIRKQLGDVLMVDFGSAERGSMDDGRNNISTEVVAPINSFLSLSAHSVEFLRNHGMVIASWVAMADQRKSLCP
ncbi:hypothetical protein Dimus_007977 [Dionaea muscipula]